MEYPILGESFICACVDIFLTFCIFRKSCRFIFEKLQSKGWLAFILLIFLYCFSNQKFSLKYLEEGERQINIEMYLLFFRPFL